MNTLDRILLNVAQARLEQAIEQAIADAVRDSWKQWDEWPGTQRIRTKVVEALKRELGTTEGE